MNAKVVISNAKYNDSTFTRHWQVWQIDYFGPLIQTYCHEGFDLFIMR